MNELSATTSEAPVTEATPASEPMPSPGPAQPPLAPGQRLPESHRRELSAEAAAEILVLASKYPDKLAATLPALYVAQKDFGFLSLAAMQEVSRVLGVPEGHIFGVATFYTMFKKQPVGKYHLQVCTNLSCALKGAAQLLERIVERTGVKPGAAPSEDGLWSVEEVECLASCGTGPCLQVNHQVYDENVDEARLEAILEACRRGEYEPWGK
jgi:NADH-quinone oxidoreductase E subunit